MEKVIITGGPCSGKTSTIQGLQDRYYHIVVPEAALQIIEEEKEGLFDHLPEDKKHPKFLDPGPFLLFQKKVTMRQVMLEQQFQGPGYCFLDRSLYDGLAYHELKNVNPNFLKEAIENNQRYQSKMFFLEPLVNFNQDNGRRENQEEAKDLSERILRVYESMDFKVIKVPPHTLEKRVKLVHEISKDLLEYDRYV